MEHFVIELLVRVIKKSKNHMRKILLINWKINTGVFIFFYLAKSFVTWNLHNPFDWILIIPDAGFDYRSGLLTGVLTWQAIQILVIMGMCGYGTNDKYKGW
jgi:hypothetical protein